MSRKKLTLEERYQQNFIGEVHEFVYAKCKHDRVDTNTGKCMDCRKRINKTLICNCCGNEGAYVEIPVHSHSSSELFTCVNPSCNKALHKL